MNGRILGLGLAVLALMSGTIGAQGQDSLEVKADSLYHTYNFSRAKSIYRNLLPMENSPEIKKRLELKSIACDNGEALLQFVEHPKVVARQSLSKKDFFLYYPEIAKSGSFIQAPHNMSSGRDTIYMPSAVNTIYFSAKDQKGKWSIHVTKKGADDVWSAPEVLGNNITSGGNDIFPFVSPDGKKLYFSSNGHYGAGGYDLYVSEWDEATNDWGIAQNMGFPYSSPSDDLFFYITPDCKFAVFSSTRNWDSPTRRSTNTDRVTSYVVEYEENPLKHSASAEEAYAISRLRLKTTQDERAENEKETVNNALDGLEENSEIIKIDSVHLAATEKYKRISLQYRELQRKNKQLLKEIENTRAAYAKFQTLPEMRDTLSVIAASIEQKEAEIFSVGEQIQAVSKEMFETEEAFLANDMLIPDFNELSVPSEKNPTAVQQPAGQVDITDLLSHKAEVQSGDFLKVEEPKKIIDLTFRIEKASELLETDDLPDGILYQIRILSLAKPVSSPAALKGLMPAFERTSPGKHQYFVGAFEKYSNALKALATVKKKFPGALIVAYNNGKATTITLARKAENAAAAKKAADRKAGIAYNLIIEGYASIPENILNILKKSGKDIAKNTSSGETRYVVGPFTDRDDAEDIVDEISLISDKKVYVETIGGNTDK
ncbi:MAG: hypothetical protein ACI3Y2_06550 [Candidatus Egerieousia sp.]